MRNTLFVMSWLSAVAAFLPGCAAFTGYPDRSEDSATELAALKPCFDPEGDMFKGYYAANTTEAERRRCRDEIVNGRVRAVDLHFERFEKQLHLEGVGLNVGTDWSVIAINATGALVGPASTKAVLHAISGGIVAMKGSIDKQVFFEKTMPVLVAKMEALRKQALVKVRTGLELDTAKYPLMNALSDVDDYYKAGTIPGAVAAIIETAGAESAEATKQLKDIRTAKFQKDRAGDALRTFWKPDGTNVDTANQQEIVDWMNAHDLRGVPITFFMRGAPFEQARLDAARELKLVP